jgi:hypothetical protein
MITIGEYTVMNINGMKMKIQFTVTGQPVSRENNSEISVGYTQAN